MSTPKFVCEGLGQSSVAVIMNIYNHVMPTLHASSAASLDALLAEPETADAEVVRAICEQTTNWPLR
jgi:hypothetical protein